MAGTRGEDYANSGLASSVFGKNGGNVVFGMRGRPTLLGKRWFPPLPPGLDQARRRLILKAAQKRFTVHSKEIGFLPGAKVRMACVLHILPDGPKSACERKTDMLAAGHSAVRIACSLPAAPTGRGPGCIASIPVPAGLYVAPRKGKGEEIS